MSIDDDVTRRLPARRGHFLLESGHHGDFWLDLEALCFEPAPIRELARGLCARIERHRIDVVCGPLIEGAFVALMVAEQLGLPFVYSQPQRAGEAGGLFPVRYQLPGVLRPKVSGRRVAVVNDVVNAGSAVRGTLEDLRACGATPIVIGTLAVLGSAARQLAADENVALETLVERPNTIWPPRDCPLCVAGIPLTTV